MDHSNKIKSLNLLSNNAKIIQHKKKNPANKDSFHYNSNLDSLLKRYCMNEITHMLILNLVYNSKGVGSHLARIRKYFKLNQYYNNPPFACILPYHSKNGCTLQWGFY